MCTNTLALAIAETDDAVLRIAEGERHRLHEVPLCEGSIRTSLQVSFEACRAAVIRELYSDQPDQNDPAGSLLAGLRQ